tara:strand:- start:53 stop:583 length:531 start_codon:yes stop_codon:yes gene_type:complete
MNNPLGLTEEDVREYLTLVARVGKAEYEYKLNYSASTTENAIDSRVKLALWREGIEGRTETFIWDEILPDSLIEQLGYVCWQGSIERGEYADNKDFFVGEIVERVRFKDGEEGCVVIPKSEQIECVDVFGNYSGLDSTLLIFNEQTNKSYIIRDEFLPRILKKDPSEEVRFQDFYD